MTFIHRSAAFVFLVGCAAAHPAPAPPPAKPVPAMLSPLAPDPTFLDAAAEGRSLVLLGESLHGTDDFPRVRLPLLRRLHEHLGFDVIAVEGSAIDAWLAQDDLYRGATIEQAAREGWLALWNTDAMRSVLQYIHQSKMYFASMDIQPGMGGTPIKRAIMRAFIERMNEYGSGGENADELASALGYLRTCSGEPALAAVARLRALVTAADAKVRARSPVHADALALVPAMLDERLHHCAEAAGDGPYVPGEYWKRYKEGRDRYQAANVLALRERVSRTHRVAVWAHHSHVAYRAGGAEAKVSLGGVLRERAAAEVFSLGVYGGSGRFLRIHDGPTSGAELADVSDHCTGLQELAALSSDPRGFFVDLLHHGADPRLAFTHDRRCYPLEGASADAVLADEFDGVVFVPRIRETKLD